ncbi:UbiA family prenyltransferase [Pararhodobacter sp. SW119]|uniref:UbiA family prenyltransferase n=1 Tax=Pararhodobacter sp. SW119 TaxID=2780075 RepID=UPI001FD8360A|nr:UbiA family prenyltransferase [Pararhodobacter sp. SW119]
MRGDGMADRVLVVDLDGTLVHSDLLFESFWAATASDWRIPFRAVHTLGKSRRRAALKRMLADCAPPDPTLLPYDEQVLTLIRDWREAGGRTALVSAADDTLVQAVADHLGLFDFARGSDGTTNLKGPAKADFLRQTFTDPGFVYAGDSTADLPVWHEADAAITVGASPALRARVEARHPDARHLSPPAASLAPALHAIRPHQWLKNLLVFLPMLAAHQFDPATFLAALAAFIAFGLVAGSVYLLNDLLDLSADRAHPRKRERPLASGALPIKQGMILILAMLGAGLLLALTLDLRFVLVLAGYYVLTVLYSIWLKRRQLIDIFVLTTLYTLRVLAGAAATAITPSVWLLAFSVFFFLSLAAVKRQAELVDAIERGFDDAKGRGYVVDDLPIVTQVATGAGFVAALVMVLYLSEPDTIARYSTPFLLWGSCLLLLYWIIRMTMVTHRGRMHDDPIVFAARDGVSQLVLALIFVFYLGAVLL